MSVNINEYRLFLEFCSNKVEVGNSESTSQFNENAHQAQMLAFEQDRAIFLATEEISDYLSFFFTNYTTSVPPTGLLPYPADWQHTASIRSYYIPPGESAMEVTCQEVKNADYGKIMSSQLQVPTKEFPKYSEFSDAYRFLPRNIGIVMIDYLREPVRPVWGFTTSASGRPVYNSAASTNFEWTQNFMNRIIGNHLKLLAVNLKDAELTNFANMFAQESKTPL